MAKHLLKSFALAFFCCLFFVGCRSYNDKAWKTVDFVSVPERATLFINGKNCGLTPRTERLSRYGSYEVRFSKPGYFDEDCRLEPFEEEDGSFDILDRVEVELLKISPETLALRERLERGESAGAAEARAELAAAEAEKTEGMSLAAVEFSKREKPTDFTDFRLQEKALKRLLGRGEITEEEYRSLHEKLYDAYNENRLLKAPRLGTYEKTN
ncbi:MAG: PEGA domain-containing protein [Candidatus Spyradosoma sp.]